MIFNARRQTNLFIIFGVKKLHPFLCLPHIPRPVNNHVKGFILPNGCPLIKPEHRYLFSLNPPWLTEISRKINVFAKIRTIPVSFLFLDRHGIKIFFSLFCALIIKRSAGRTAHCLLWIYFVDSVHLIPSDNKTQGAYYQLAPGRYRHLVTVKLPPCHHCPDTRNWNLPSPWPRNHESLTFSSHGQM